MLACADEKEGTTMSLDLASRAKKYEEDMDDTGFWIGKVTNHKFTLYHNLTVGLLLDPCLIHPPLPMLSSSDRKIACSIVSCEPTSWRTICSLPGDNSWSAVLLLWAVQKRQRGRHPLAVKPSHLSNESTKHHQLRKLLSQRCYRQRKVTAVVQ